MRSGWMLAPGLVMDAHKAASIILKSAFDFYQEVQEIHEALKRIENLAFIIAVLVSIGLCITSFGFFITIYIAHQSNRRNRTELTAPTALKTDQRRQSRLDEVTRQDSAVSVGHENRETVRTKDALSLIDDEEEEEDGSPKSLTSFRKTSGTTMPRRKQLPGGIRRATLY